MGGNEDRQGRGRRGARIHSGRRGRASIVGGLHPDPQEGKLPHATVSIPYSLEYGLDHMEMHEDAVTKGERVILVDDLIATGGTAEGAVKLLRQMGAEVVAACSSSIFRTWRGGQARSSSVPVRSLVTFQAIEACRRLGGRRDLAHFGADEEAFLAAIVEREHAAAAGDDVDHDVVCFQASYCEPLI